MLLVSCVQQTPQTTVSAGFNPVPPRQEENTTPPLNALQKQALGKMQQALYDDAIRLLQRALNVEPRNPLNWHLLARNYQAKGDLERCRDMAQRAHIYTRGDYELERKNIELLGQCR